jgi:GNAT superfamily N-acetyltransferase
MDDKLKSLYNNVSAEYDLPDYETFVADMQDEVKRKKLYDAISTSYELPDYETFSADMGLKKKEPTTQDLSQPVKPSQQNLERDRIRDITARAINGDMGALAELQRLKSIKSTPVQPLESQKIDITQKASSTATAPKSIERTTVNVKDIYRGKSSDQFDLEAIEQKKRQGEGADRINALSEENAFYNAVENDYLEYLQNEDENKYRDTKAKLEELREQQKSGNLSLGQEKWLKDFRQQAVGLKNEALADRVKFMTNSPEFKAYERKAAILDQIGADQSEYQKAAAEAGISPEMIVGIKDAERNFINARFASEKAEQDFPNAARAEKENLIKEIDRTAKAQAGNTEFFNQFSGTVGRGALSVMQVPKVLSDMFGDTDYTLVDELYDKMEGMKFSREGRFGALKESDLPAMYQLSEIAGQAAGSMAMFAAGGAGAASTAQQVARTASTAFLTSQPEYYADAIAMGKSPKEAATDANVLALVTSMAEGVIPDISLLEGQTFKRSVSAAYKSGKTVKESVRLAMKEMPEAFKERALDVSKGMLKEGGEEVGQTGTEDVTKEGLNLRSTIDYETFDLDNYKKALLGGFIAGGGARVIASAMPKSKEMQGVIRDAVENKDEILADMESVGADVTEAKTVLENASERLEALKSHSNWNNLSKEKQNEAFFMAEQMAAIEQEQEKLAAVRAVDAKKDAELKAIEDELNATLNAKLVVEETKTPAETEVMQDETLVETPLSETAIDSEGANIAETPVGEVAETSEDEATPVETDLGTGESVQLKQSEKPSGNYEIAQQATNEISTENPDVSILLTPKGDDLNLTAVYVGKEKRNKGIGTKVLESVKRQADKLGKKVVLDATNELDEETDLERLGKFYEKNGFVKVGENKFEYNPKEQAESVQEEKPQPKKLDSQQVKHNNLIAKTENFNQLSESKRKKSEGAALLNQIMLDAKDLGYKAEYGSTGAKLRVLKDGKKIARFPQPSMTRIIESSKPLSERSEPTQRFVNKLAQVAKANPLILKGIDFKMRRSEAEGALKDIVAGKKTLRADELLRQIDKMTSEDYVQFFEMVAGEKVLTEVASIDEFLEFLETESYSEAQLAQEFDEYYDNLTDEQKQQIQDEYEQFQQAEAELLGGLQSTENVSDQTEKSFQQKTDNKTVVALSEMDKALELKGTESTTARNQIKEKYGKKMYDDLLKVTRNFEKIITELESQGKITKKC